MITTFNGLTGLTVLVGCCLRRMTLLEACAYWHGLEETRFPRAIEPSSNGLFHRRNLHSFENHTTRRSLRHMHLSEPLFVRFATNMGCG
jgi:hypothetical protein